MTTSVELMVDGMTCGGCASSVSKALQAVPGVTAVSVALAERRVSIEHDGSVAQAALCEAVENAGFDVVS